MTISNGPDKLASLLQANIKYLKDDQIFSIKSKVSSDFEGIIKNCNKLLEKNEVEKVINIEIPKLQAYLKDPNLNSMVSS